MIKMEVLENNNVVTLEKSLPNIIFNRFLLFVFTVKTNENVPKNLTFQVKKKREWTNLIMSRPECPRYVVGFFSIMFLLD